VEAASTGYLEAFADGDGVQACRHLAARAQRDLTTIADTRSCPGAIEQLHALLDERQRDKLRGSRVARIRIDGAHIKVTMGEADTLTSEKVAGRWKVAAFAAGGYRPRAEGECIIAGMHEFESGDVHAFWLREGRADFRDFLVETCRRADRQGVLREDSPEAARRAFNRNAGRVVAQMVERGQIREPR
jgi:hypothetical protein